MDEACCTCAALLHTITPSYDEKTEKPKALDRRLDCCGRTVCGNCIASNTRFASYCPYCQVSTAPTSLPQGLKDPPSYSPTASSSNQDEPPSYTDELPAYTFSSAQNVHSEKETPSEDVLHFLDHRTDTLASLSLRYGVPIPVLRKANTINADNLLLARRTVIIPGTFYKGGVSLSPRPVEGEEEERRKGLVRKWMIACKVAEYDVALLYLEQADYDLIAATSAYKEDEQWEKDHPIETRANRKGKTRHDVGKRRFTGQRS